MLRRPGKPTIVAFGLVLAFSLVAASAHALPGKPIGIGTQTGSLNRDYNAWDEYCIRLVEGVPLDVRRSGALLYLLAPDATEVVFGWAQVSRDWILLSDGQLQWTSWRDADGTYYLRYTPAVSGVHYIVASLGDRSDRATYSFTTSGGAFMPSTSTTWAAFVDSATISYGSKAAVSGSLRPVFAPHLLVSGESAVIEQSADSTNWVPLATGWSSYFFHQVTPTVRTYYRFNWAGRPPSPWSAAVSSVLTVTPGVAIGGPSCVSRVYRTEPVMISGTIAPRHASGSSPVRILMWKSNAVGDWESKGEVETVASDVVGGSKYSSEVTFTEAGLWLLQAVHSADNLNAETSSGFAYVTVEDAYASTPVAPSTVSRTRSFAVYGYLKPRHASGSKPVKIRCYRKTSAGVYEWHHDVRATVSNYSTYSKYKASVRLPHPGTWRLSAFAPADSLHAAVTSRSYDYVSVR